MVTRKQPAPSQPSASEPIASASRICYGPRLIPSLPMDDPNLAYAPPDEAETVQARPSGKRFARPSALAGALLLVHRVLVALLTLANYAWLGLSPGWVYWVVTSVAVVLGIGLIRSEDRFLPVLTLALLTLFAVSGFPFMYREALFTRLVIQVFSSVFELLPFSLLLLGRPQPLRCRLAIALFAFHELVMIGGSVTVLISRAHYRW